MSTDDIKFDKDTLDESEEYFKKLHLSSGQRRKIRLVSKLATNYIPINEHAMAGFAYRAIQAYQVENKIELNKFESMDDKQKLEMVSDVFERIKGMLTKAILKPDQSHLLDKAIKESYEFYKNKLL